MYSTEGSHNQDELLLQLRNGNKQILLELYNQNRTMITSYITKNSGTTDDAQDILHDSLIVLWKNIRDPKFELSSKPSTYLMGVAKNLWLKKLDKAKRTSTADITGLEVSEAPLSIHQLDVKKAMLALDEIGETCKNLLSMFYFDKFSMQEIATQLNYANTDTAKAKKHQCFKRLSEIIKSRYKITDLLN